MALNRLIDWRIDALNPRTQNRHLPKGLVKPWETLLLALLGLGLLVYAGLRLNPLTARLLPVAVFFLTFYSYTKRFTWLCHYVLGLTIGAAAAGGWIAVTGSFAPTAYWLWAGVGLWIAGFDILYATQDFAFDRPMGCKASPPASGFLGPSPWPGPPTSSPGWPSSRRASPTGRGPFTTWAFSWWGGYSSWSTAWSPPRTFPG